MKTQSSNKKATVIELGSNNKKNCVQEELSSIQKNYTDFPNESREVITL